MSKSSLNQNINWFPGHMKTSLNDMEKSISLVDIALEVADARIPISSRNPEFSKILKNKESLLILNKEDLADPVENFRWISFYRENGQEALLYDAQKKGSAKIIYDRAREVLKSEFHKREERGIEDPTIKMMVIGIPNVGKSTLINTLAKRRGTKVGNKPGVTRSKQWIKTEENIVLLDTPGVLWPKFQSEEIGKNLAYTMAIKDDLLDVENLAFDFLEDIRGIYPNLIMERYGLEELGTTVEIFCQIGKKRGAIRKKGEVDYHRTGQIILDDFRKGRLGRISLERVDG